MPETTLVTPKGTQGSLQNSKFYKKHQNHSVKAQKRMTSVKPKECALFGCLKKTLKNTQKHSKTLPICLKLGSPKQKLNFD